MSTISRHHSVRETKIYFTLKKYYIVQVKQSNGREIQPKTYVMKQKIKQLEKHMQDWGRKFSYLVFALRIKEVKNIH